MNLDLRVPDDCKAFWVVGDLYSILASGDDTGGAYAMIHAVVAPGGGPPPHRHHCEDEAFFILEGNLSLHADGRSWAATPGAWVTLPKGSLHYFRNTGTEPVKMLILVSPSGLEKFFEEVGTVVTDRSPAAVPPADIEKLMAVAPRYGLEIYPPA